MAKKKKTAREKYFEGYSYTKIDNPNGRGTKIIPTYEGDVYTLAGDDRQNIKKKITAGALLVLYFALCIGAGMFRVTGWVARIMSITDAAALIAGCYLIKGVLDLIISRRNMTEFEYNEYRKEIKQGTFLGMVASGALVAEALVLLVMSIIGGEAVNGALFAMLFGACAVGSLYALRLLEEKSVYTIKEGTYKSPEKYKNKTGMKRDQIPEFDESDLEDLF